SYATDENGDFIIHAGEYDIISRPVRLRETIERTYEKNTGEYFETQTNFYWNSEALQLQKVEKTLASSSIGRRVKGQKYLYCTDYAQEGFVEKLMQTHQINKPIEIVSYEGSTGTLEEYSIVDGKVNVYTDDM